MVKYADAYLRYSTHKQDEGLSIEYQQAEVEKYCATNNIVVKNWYIDKALTAGKIAGRKNFERYIQTVDNGTANEILIGWSTNRVFRNATESLLMSDILMDKGVTILFATQVFNLNTSDGRLMYGVNALIDEHKISQTSEQVTAAMKFMVSQKLFTGGTVPYGFKLEPIKFNGKKKNRIVPDEETRHNVVKVFEMYANGFNSVQIFEWFKSFDNNITLERVRKMLSRPLYKGTFIYQPKGTEPLIVEDYCEPLVSEELYEAVQKRKEKNKEEYACRRSRKINYILTGHIKCGLCGSNCTGNSAGPDAEEKGWIYYRCTYKGHAEKKCKAKAVRKDALERTVFNEIVQNLLTEKTIKELSDKVIENVKNAPNKAQDKKELIARQNKLQKEIAELVQMKLNGDIDGETMVFMKKPKEEELSLVKHQLKEIEMIIENTIDEKIIRKKVKEIFNVNRPFDSCDDDTLQLLFEQCVDKIIVNNTQVEIHLRINLSTILDKPMLGLPNVTLSKVFSKTDLNKNKR